MRTEPTGPDPTVDDVAPPMSAPVTDPPDSDPVLRRSVDAPRSSTAPDDAAPVADDDVRGSDGGTSTLKVAAVIAGATALANKVRHEAPKKLQEVRDRRAAGRFVIITEVDGRPVALGPFKDERAARDDPVGVGGASTVVELVPGSTFRLASRDAEPR